MNKSAGRMQSLRQYSEILLVYEVHLLHQSNNGSKICISSSCDFFLDQIMPVLVEAERCRNKAQRKSPLCPEAYIPRVAIKRKINISQFFLLNRRKDDVYFHSILTLWSHTNAEQVTSTGVKLMHQNSHGPKETPLRVKKKYRRCVNTFTWTNGSRTENPLWALMAKPFISPPVLEPPEAATVWFKPHAQGMMKTAVVRSHVGNRPQMELGKQPDPGISCYPAHKSGTHKGTLVTAHMADICVDTKGEQTA